MFRIASIVVLALLIAAPASAKGKDKDYQGADGGYLVYAVGTAKIGMGFEFPYRQVEAGRADAWAGRIEPSLGGAIYLKVKNPDFTGEESGHVIVRRLPPGRYEVGSFSFAGSNLAGTSYRWSPSKPFALPFTIRPGQATYIGSFVRAPSLGTPLQPALGAAGYFVVADRQDRDLPLAKPKLPAGTPVAIEVTDVAPFASPAMRTSHP